MLEGDVWPLPEKASAHPRGAGSFGRILGRYVRERQVISLMEALRRMSLVPAQVLEAVDPQMKQEGRLQAGADADITIFDSETVIDRATHENPGLTSAGILHVLVNGHAVVKEQELVKEALPGQRVRGPKC
jgi:N-acyl-D-aspartate/D-glutamate deacylase